jgi:Tripartite tricarboxylate transporter TctB family
LKGGAVWMALGLALLVGAWRMDRFESMGASLYTAPGLVPGIYGLLLLALGGALAWRARQAPAAAPEPLLNRRILLTLALTLAYAAVAVGRLPFGPSTAVFVAVFCWLFDERSASWPRLRTALIAGVACALLVVLVFERVFLVRLP